MWSEKGISQRVKHNQDFTRVREEHVGIVPLGGNLHFGGIARDIFIQFLAGI